MSLEVYSVLHSILSDDELVEMAMDAANAAGIENPERLRAELQLRLAECRLLEQYGSLDEWDCDSWR